MKNINRSRKSRRKRRVSRNIFGSSTKPRITVFRSNKYIYAQAIDDEKRVTLASSSSLDLKKNKDENKLTKTEESKLTGQELANKLKEIKIDTAVFDRGASAYAGRVKALAESLRKNGIKI